MNKTRLALLIAIAAAIVLFFAFDLGQFFSLEYFKSKQAEIMAFHHANPWQTALVFFAIYVAVTGLSLPGAAIMTLVAGGMLQWTGSYVPLFVLAGIMHPMAWITIRTLAGRGMEPADLDGGLRTAFSPRLLLGGLALSLAGLGGGALVLVQWEAILKAVKGSIPAAAGGLGASILVALIGVGLLWASRTQKTPVRARDSSCTAAVTSAAISGVSGAPAHSTSCTSGEKRWAAATRWATPFCLVIRPTNATIGRAGSTPSSASTDSSAPAASTGYQTSVSIPLRTTCTRFGSRAG